MFSPSQSHSPHCREAIAAAGSTGQRGSGAQCTGVGGQPPCSCRRLSAAPPPPSVHLQPSNSHECSQRHLLACSCALVASVAFHTRACALHNSRVTRQVLSTVGRQEAAPRSSPCLPPPPLPTHPHIHHTHVHHTHVHQTLSSSLELRSNLVHHSEHARGAAWRRTVGGKGCRGGSPPLQGAQQSECV